MNWLVELSESAERDLRRLPGDVRQRLAQALDDMEKDPFQGDVRPLRGRRWKDRYRKRVGRYRIIFTADHARRAVGVSAVLLRSEKTYR
jgi:mRNA-degrading endonuclease RelE of RelBE toxin-antitoxin system